MEQEGKEGSANAANQLQNQPPPAGDVKRPNSPPPHLKCARCDSSNTKFCYYNNYSRSQPRYFCRACRRYWTHGGTLRNVPIGGGARRNRRPLRVRPAAAPAAVASSGQASKALQPAMPEPPAPIMGNTFYGGGSFLPSFSASQFGANLSLLQAMTLQSLKPPAAGNLFPAQQNLITQPLRTWAPNMNTTGSSSADVGPSFMDQAGPSCSAPNEWLADNRQG